MRRPAQGGDGIARQVLSEAVRDRLLEWIREGRYEPGERLIEKQIASELGVSATPIREAIKALSMVGVVEAAPFHGARVRVPDQSELIDAIQVRAELEALGARLAAERITVRELDSLERLMADMIDAAGQRDAREYSLKNAEFHVTILKAARNEPLERAWRTLEPFTRTYITSTLPGVDLVALARRHKKVLRAIRGGDPDRAAAAMRTHLHEVAVATDASSEKRGRDGAGRASHVAVPTKHRASRRAAAGRIPAR